MKFNKLMKIRSSICILPFFLLGMNSCNDQDNDGYTSAQGDCDDSNPEVNPGAEEVSGDGIDNNCNGKIDELMFYAQFLDQNDLPVEGIPAWVGQSADSEVIFSDENGKIEIELDSSSIIFNYANKYTFTYYDELGTVFYTNENFDINTVELTILSTTYYDFNVTQSEDIVESEVPEYMSGYINNVDTDSLNSGTSKLYMSITGGDVVYSGASPAYSVIDSDSVSYSRTYFAGNTMAYQYNSSSLNKIPTGVDIVCESKQEQDFSLENIFDQKISFDVDNISPYSTNKYYYSRLFFCGVPYSIVSSSHFKNGNYDITDTSDVANSVYAVNPDNFSSTSIDMNYVSMYTTGVSLDDNLSFSQRINLKNPYTTTVSTAMPDLFHINSTLDFSINDISGMEIDYSLGDLKNWELSALSFSFSEFYLNPDFTKWVGYSWYQYTGSSDKLTISDLPASILEYWPSVDSDMERVYSYSDVSLYYKDSLNPSLRTSASKYVSKQY